MTRSRNLAVTVLDDLASIEGWRAEWEDLERRTPESTGFQSYLWCHAWTEVVSADSSKIKPRIVVVHEARRIVLIWPLQVEPLFGLRWARGLGQPVTQYGDALAEQGGDRAYWVELAMIEIRRWRDVDLVSLIQVRRDGVLAGSGGIDTKHSTRSAPLLVFARQNFCAPNAVTSRSQRRRERRLTGRGIVLDIPDDPQQSRASALQVLDLKEAWLGAKRLHSPTFTQPLSRPFFAKLAAYGALRVHLLKIDGSIAAGDLGIVGGNIYRSLISAYDQRFAFGAPGHVLTRLLIGHYRRTDLQGIDLLAPVEPYKLRITNVASPLDTIHVPFTWRGYAGLFASLYLRPLLQAGRRWRGRFTSAQ